MKKHMGFKNAAKSIAKRQHVPLKQANAELAAGTRRVSAKAKRANPRLKKVRG